MEEAAGALPPGVFPFSPLVCGEGGGGGGDKLWPHYQAASASPFPFPPFSLRMCAFAAEEGGGPR